MSVEKPEFYVPSGKFKGQLIDTRTRRTFELVEETADYYLIDYFFHNSDFYRAKVPKESVQKVIGQRFNFSTSLKDKAKPFLKRLTKIKNPFMNHVQVRFVLDSKNPIELFPMGGDINSDPINKLTDLIYSIEVVGPKGMAWSVFRSFGDFITAHRMLSVAEVVFERVTLGQYVVQQTPPLLMNPKKMNDALDTVIKRGHSAGMKEHYYLITFKFGAVNCTSETFKMLDALMFDEYSFFQKWLSRALWRLPLSAKMYLKARGVIDPKAKTLTLNEEFKELATSDLLVDRVPKKNS